MFIVIFIVLYLFANPCNRFVDMIRSSFPIYTCLGHSLERAAVGSGKGRWQIHSRRMSSS